MYSKHIRKQRELQAVLIYEYKLDACKEQYAAIDNANRVVQFVRNKCIRLGFCPIIPPTRSLPFAARLPH